MTDTATIEHLREINIRLSERVERLESELIKERAHSKQLSEDAFGALVTRAFASDYISTRDDEGRVSFWRAI